MYHPISNNALIVIQMVPAMRSHVQPHTGLRPKVFSLTYETIGCPFVHPEISRIHIIHGRTSGIMSELVLALEIDFEPAGKVEFEES
jgi:hypothetical protein